MTREEELRAALNQWEGNKSFAVHINVSWLRDLLALLDESRKSVEAHAEYLTRMTEERDAAVKAKEATELERDEARRERDEYGKQLEAFREWKAKACRLEAALEKAKVYLEFWDPDHETLCSRNQLDREHDAMDCPDVREFAVIMQEIDAALSGETGEKS